MSKEVLARMVEGVERLIALAAEHAPTDSAALAAALAISAEVSGDTRAAIAAYEAPHRAAPDEPVHANNLAYAMARFDEDLERALELVARAQGRVGEPVPSYMDTEAWVRYRLGDLTGAMNLIARTLHGTFEQEGELGGAQSEMLFHYATIREASGGDAEAFWRDCARREPRGLYGERCAQRLKTLRREAPN